jgi:ACS family hexuronate transporter-like MFS transporter
MLFGASADVHHVPMSTMGVLTAIPWIAGAMGSIVAGFGPDVVFQRMKQPMLARKISAWLPLGLSCACVLLVNSASSLWIAVLSKSLALFF